MSLLHRLPSNELRAIRIHRKSQHCQEKSCLSPSSILQGMHVSHLQIKASDTLLLTSLFPFRAGKYIYTAPGRLGTGGTQKGEGQMFLFLHFYCICIIIVLLYNRNDVHHQSKVWTCLIKTETRQTRWRDKQVFRICGNYFKTIGKASQVISWSELREYEAFAKLL